MYLNRLILVFRYGSIIKSVYMYALIFWPVSKIFPNAAFAFAPFFFLSFSMLVISPLLSLVSSCIEDINFYPLKTAR